MFTILKFFFVFFYGQLKFKDIKNFRFFFFFLLANGFEKKFALQTLITIAYVYNCFLKTNWEQVQMTCAFNNDMCNVRLLYKSCKFSESDDYFKLCVNQDISGQAGHKQPVGLSGSDLLFLWCRLTRAVLFRSVCHF